MLPPVVFGYITKILIEGLSLAHCPIT